MTTKQDYRNKRKALMLAAYYGGDQCSLDNLYRRGEHADGDRCPDCGSTEMVDDYDGNGQFHCDCGHTWHAADYDMT